MKQLIFVKKDIIDEFAFSINSFENADRFIKNKLNVKDTDKETIYTISSRREALTEILNLFNDTKCKLISLVGFQGTGKTELIKASFLFLDDALKFYYECSESSHLDDVFLRLHRYLREFIAKEQAHHKKNSGSKSIDEKLVYYLKNIKKPLLLVIDGFENLINEDNTFKEKEFLKFINFLVSLPNVKLVLSGRTTVFEGLNLDDKKISKIRLSGIDESDAVRILQDHNLLGSEQVLYQAYQTTRGYPESLYWLISSVNVLKQSPFDILKDYSTHKEGFEEYILRKIYSNIPVSIKKLLWFFAVIRHSLKSNKISRLNFSKNLDEALNYLVSNHLLNVNYEYYHLKDFLRELIYPNIPYEEKIKLHTFLNNFYTEQLSIKLENRIISVSRKTLHSEQYYHKLCLDRLKSDPHSAQTSHYTSELPFVSSYIASKYDLGTLSSKLAETVMSEDVIIKDEAEIGQKSDQTSTMVSSDPVGDSKILESIEIDPNVKIELSEEERALLSQNNSDEVEEKTTDSTIKIAVEEIKPEIKREKTPEEIRDEFINKAIASRKEGNPELSLIYYKKALEMAENYKDSLNVARVSRSIGNILQIIRQYEESLEYLTKSFDAFLLLNDINNSSQILLKIAGIYKDRQKFDDALYYYNKVLELEYNGEVPDKAILNALTCIGDIHEHRNEIDIALKYYFRALDRVTNIDDLEISSKIYFKIGYFYDHINNTNSAMEFYKKNLQVSTDSKVNPFVATVYANMASLYEDINDTNNAIIHYIKSLDIDKLNKNYSGQYKTLSRLGNIYDYLDVYDKALGYFNEEVQAAKLTKDPYAVSIACIDIGDFYLSKKQFENALRYFIKARKAVGKTVSTDSKEKIDRRFKQIMSEIGEVKFNILVENIRRKYG